MKNILILSAILFLNLNMFGQKPAPAFLVLDSFPNVRDLTMLSNGDEAYVTLQSPLEELSVIARLFFIKGEWVIDELPDFTGKYMDKEPALSFDGLRLYFASNRPDSDSLIDIKDFDIWYVERSGLDEKWGNPVNIGEPVNSEYNEFYPCLSKNNNIYFTSDRPEGYGKDDLFCSKWNGHSYSKPTNLDSSINTAGYEYNAFISPEEDFLIFGAYNRPDGHGSGDLYISFAKNGQWTPSVNVGLPFNSKQMDYCPFYFAADQMLYFTSKRSHFEKINDFKSLRSYLMEINKPENGQSKIYKSHFSLKDYKD